MASAALSDDDAPEPIARNGVLLSPVTFSDLPGWRDRPLNSSLVAFRQSCGRFSELPDGPLSAAYAGDVEAWRDACAAAWTETWHDPHRARAFFESRFRAYRLTFEEGTEGRLTAYFEPEIEARREREPPFVEPILAPPADLIVELSVGEGGRVLAERWRRRPDGVREAYPTRSEIYAAEHEPLAWGRVSDVTFLQIQGSGRLRFPDGEVVRAAYAAHNGRDYRSILRILLDQGAIAEDQAHNDAVRAWLGAVPLEEARAALNQNDRYVFFTEQPLSNRLIGPVGAAGQPLAPGASIAVDPDHHTYGTLFWLASDDETAPDPRLTVAQDTGGAITGPLRADLFLGTGARAGAAADNVNHTVRWWALLPLDAAQERGGQEAFDGQTTAER